MLRAGKTKMDTQCRPTDAVTQLRRYDGARPIWVRASVDTIWTLFAVRSVFQVVITWTKTLRITVKYLL